MKRASVSELKNKLSAYLRRVKAGESVLVTDRGQPIARLEPLRGPAAADARLARLIAEGVIIPPKNPMSHEELAKFLRRPLPTSKKSVLEALLEEREEERKEGNR
jgi:prevent-host-death family protein